VIKNIGSLGRNLVGLISSLIVGSSVFYVLDFPFFEKFIFALIFSAITFLLYKFIIEKNNVESTTIEATNNNSNLKDLLFITLTAFSIIAVILIPSFSNNQYFDWYSIPFVNWVRLISAVFLTTFAPGYVILHFIDRRNQLKGVEVLIFSYLISIFFIPLLSYVTILLGLSLGEFVIPLQLGFNLILLSAFIVHIGKHRLKNMDKKVKMPLSRHSAYIISILFFITLFVLVSEWCIRNYTFLAPVTDFGEHLSNALRLLDGKFVFQISSYDPELWFHLYLGSFFNLSGFPSINAYAALTPLVIVPYLAVFAMTSAFFGGENKKIPIVATFFALLSGFGWMYMISLRTNLPSTTDLLNTLQTGALKTYDTFPTFPNEPVPVYIIGLPILFMLLFLVVNHKLSGPTRFSLFSILVAIDFMAHGGAELVFFAPIFFILALFSNPEFTSSMKKLSLSILLGSVIAVGLLLLGKFFVFNPFDASGFITILMYLVIFTAVVTYVALQCRKWVITAISHIISTIKNNTHKKIEILIIQGSKFKKAIIFGLVTLIIYLYGLSFIIWSQIFPQFSADEVVGYYTPLYFIPMRLGVCGLLVLAYIIFLLFENKKLKREEALILILIMAPILFENIINYVLSDPIKLSLVRFWFYIPTFVGVLAAVALVRFTSSLEKLNLQKKVRSIRLTLNPRLLVGVLLLLIIIFGVFSSLLNIERLTLLGNNSSHLSNNELDALDYIRANSSLNLNTSIVTLSDISYQILQRFGEVWQPQIAGSSLLFSLRSPESVLSILGQSRVEFVYMAQRDFSELASIPDSYMARLLDFLPIVFKNEDVTIYEVPANISLVTPNSMTEPNPLLSTKNTDLSANDVNSGNSSGFTYLSNYGCFFGNATFSGDVSVTSYFFGLNASMKVKQIDLSQTTISSEHKISSLDLCNVSIIGLDSNNSVISTLTTTAAETLTNTQGSITSFSFPEDYNLTMTLTNNESLNLTLKNNVDGTIFYVTALGGSLNFLDVSSTFVMFKAPLIVTNGVTSFSGNVYIKNNQAIFENLFPISPLTINGYSSFKIDFSDIPSFISDFSYNGTYTVPPSAAKLNWNNLASVPWGSVFTSPFHIVLILGIIGIVFVFIRKRQIIPKTIESKTN